MHTRAKNNPPHVVVLGAGFAGLTFAKAFPRGIARLTVVIGGGPTGVELAGACAELQRHLLPREFRRLDPRMARVVLIESGPRVLSAYPPALSEKAKQQLEELGVTVWLGTRVKDIRCGEVIAGSESLRAGTIIWAAGVSASPLTAQLGVECDRTGRAKVSPDLSVPAHPEILCAGR